MLRKNFQMFADDDQETKQPEKKYTDEDVNRIVDEKFAKWQKARDAEEKKRQKEMAEAEKLKNMTESEKTNKRLEELETQLADYKARELKGAMERQARRMFQDAGLGDVADEIVSQCTGETAEETKASVESMIAMIQKQVERMAKDAVDRQAPKAGTKSKLTKAQIMDIEDRNERQKQMREHWDLFQK